MQNISAISNNWFTNLAVISMRSGQKIIYLQIEKIMRMAEAELMTDIIIATLEGIQSKNRQINSTQNMMKISKIGRK